MAGSSKPNGRRRRPKQGRSRALVDAVIEASLDLLKRRDEGEPPVRTIADRAGVGVGSIYEYFSDRDGLMDAVTQRLTSENFRQMERVLDAHRDDPLDALIDAVLGETWSLYVEQSALTRAAIRTILRFGKLDAITAERDRFVKKLAAAIHARLPNAPRDEVDASTRAVTDMTMGVAVSELYRDSSDEDRRAQLGAVRRMMQRELAHVRALHEAAAAERAPDESAA